jgi:hypothetical protein
MCGTNLGGGMDHGLSEVLCRCQRGRGRSQALFREWENEVDARIEAIRAERTGEGIALTPQQARALAGEISATSLCGSSRTGTRPTINSSRRPPPDADQSRP